jgi:hypothetical protein
MINDDEIKELLGEINTFLQMLSVSLTATMAAKVD